jgi:hypothetical protein
MDTGKMLRATCVCEAHQVYWTMFTKYQQQLRLFEGPALEEEFLKWARTVGAGRRMQWCRPMRDVTYPQARTERDRTVLPPRAS